MPRRLAVGLLFSAAVLSLAGGAAAALGLTAANFGFGLTITGADQTPPFSFNMTATGTNGAFNIAMSATQFQSGSNSLGFPTVTGIVTGACTGGGCRDATNTITSYPMLINTTAQKIYSTADAKATIPLTVNLTVGLPGNAFAGAYASTFTLTIASGP